MKTDFQAAMRRALELVRGQKVMEATRVIQRALSRAGRQQPESPQDERAGAPPFSDETARLERPTDPGGRSAAEARPVNGGALIGWKGAPPADPTERAPFPGAAFAAPNRAEAADAVRREARTPGPGANEAPAWRRPADRARRLADVLRRLREEFPLPRGAPSPGLRKGPSVSPPEGAVWLARSFSCPAGSRNYKVYAPSRARTGARPLIVMLHGCTQDPDDFAVGTGMNRLAEERGVIVVYPEQPTAANPSACWNWFRRANQRRDEGEPAILAGVVRAVTADFAVDPARVYVAGLSAGGAMAAILATTYPDVFAAAGIHSGLPYGAAGNLPAALAAMRGTKKPSKAPAKRRARGRVRTIVFHGRSDTTVSPSNAEAILADARASLPDHEDMLLDGVAGGRAFTRTIVMDARGVPHAEGWFVEGLGHAWSGGSPEGSFADAEGPDASREMLRFFLETEAR